MGNLLSWLSLHCRSDNVQLKAEQQYREKQKEEEYLAHSIKSSSSSKQSKESSTSIHKTKKSKNRVEARTKRKKTNVEHTGCKSSNELRDEDGKQELALSHAQEEFHETTHEMNWSYTPPPDNQRSFYFVEDKIQFTSQFDSGNMIVVERVAALTYNVYSAFDCGNSPKQTNNRQWFHFAVRGLRTGDVLTITVIGVTHSNMFTYNWTPVIAYEANSINVAQQYSPHQEEYEQCTQTSNVFDKTNPRDIFCCCCCCCCCCRECKGVRNNNNLTENEYKRCCTTVSAKLPLEYKRLLGESVVTTHTRMPPTPGYPSFVYHECDKSKQDISHNEKEQNINNLTSPANGNVTSADVMTESSNNNNIDHSDDEEMHSAVSLPNEEDNANDNSCSIAEYTQVEVDKFRESNRELDDNYHKPTQQSAICGTTRTADEEKSAETVGKIMYKMQEFEIDETQMKSEAEIIVGGKEKNMQRSRNEAENEKNNEVHMIEAETEDVDQSISKTENKSEGVPKKIKKSKKKDIAMSLTFSIYVEHDVPLLSEQTLHKSEYSALYIASNHPYSYTTLQDNIVGWHKLAEEFNLIQSQQEILENKGEIEKETSELESISGNDDNNNNSVNRNITSEANNSKDNETLVQTETMESTENASVITNTSNTKKEDMPAKNECEIKNNNNMKKVYFHHEVLCTSLDDLNVDLLTITDMSKVNNNNERMPAICTSPVIIPFNSSSLSHHLEFLSPASTISSNDNHKVNELAQIYKTNKENAQSSEQCLEPECEEWHLSLESSKLSANSTEQLFSSKEELSLRELKMECKETKKEYSRKSYKHNTLRPFQFDASKKVVVLSARVHPGECAGSHVMHGCIEFLLNAHDKRAAALREHFVFILIPMLNPDGVRRGHSRVDGNGVDLNRMYRNPSHTQHPSVFALKSLLLQLIRDDRLALYIDLHAHANKRSTFLYGNSMPMTQLAESILYAKLISLNTSYFDFKYCNFSESNMFTVGKSGRSKDGSCRVMLFLETGFHHAYVIEASHVAGNDLKGTNTASRSMTDAITAAAADFHDKDKKSNSNNNNSEKSDMTRETEQEENKMEVTNTHLTNKSHRCRSAKILETFYFDTSAEEVYGKSDRDACSFQYNKNVNNNDHIYGEENDHEEEEKEEEDSETKKMKNAMCKKNAHDAKERSKSTSDECIALRGEKEQQQQQQQEQQQESQEHSKYKETNAQISFCDYSAKSNYNDADAALESAIDDINDGKDDKVNNCSNKFKENTNQYSPQTFAETGKAVLFALLDINNCNPQSRLSRTPYHSLSGLKLWLHRQMQLSLAENVFMHIYKERDATGKKKCHARNNTEVQNTNDNTIYNGNNNNWEDSVCTPSRIISTIMTLPRYEQTLNKMTIRNSRLLPPITYNDVHSFLPARVAISLLTQTPSNAVLRTLAAECSSQETKPREELPKKRFTFIKTTKLDEENNEQVSNTGNFCINKVCRHKAKDDIPFSLHYKSNICNIYVDKSNSVNREKNTECNDTSNTAASGDDDDDNKENENDNDNSDDNSHKEYLYRCKNVNASNASTSNVCNEGSEVQSAPVIAKKKKCKVSTI